MAEIYNASGHYLGSIRENGEMYDEYGTYMGRIDRDGYIYDSRGTSIGAIWSNGHIYLNGSYVGLIDTEGYVYRDSSYVGHITGYRGAGMKKTVSAVPKKENSSAHKSAAHSAASAAASAGGDSVLLICFIIALVVMGIAVLIAVAIFAAIAAVVIAAVSFVVYMLLCVIAEDKVRGKTVYKVLSVAISVILIAGVYLVYDYAEGKGLIGSDPDTSVGYSQTNHTGTTGGNGNSTGSDTLEEEDLWAEYELPTRELYYDPDNLMSGNDVRYVQFVLIKADILDLDEDAEASAVFDQDTDIALRAYQITNGIQSDGIAAGETLDLIQEDFESITGTKTEQTDTADSAVLQNLQSGCWENFIQDRCVYRFFEDGTVTEYSIEPGAAVTNENLSETKTYSYRVEGDSVIIGWNAEREITLSPVTIDDAIDWDMGLAEQLAAIPSGETFYYETGWEAIGDEPDNAMYFVKCEGT